MLHLFVNFTPDRRLIDTHCFTGTGIPVTSINDYIALVCTILMCINWPPAASSAASMCVDKDTFLHFLREAARSSHAAKAVATARQHEQD